MSKVTKQQPEPTTDVNMTGTTCTRGGAVCGCCASTSLSGFPQGDAVKGNIFSDPLKKLTNHIRGHMKTARDANSAFMVATINHRQVGAGKALIAAGFTSPGWCTRKSARIGRGEHDDSQVKAFICNLNEVKLDEEK